MNSSSIDRIIDKSKNMIFEAKRAYRPHGRACVPYEEQIVSHPAEPETIYLVHKNIIMDKGSVCDSSYTVYSFDLDGNYIQREEEKEPNFFREAEVIKNIL